MCTKWDIEKLNEFYKENGCSLISEQYKNEDTYLTYICKCGKEDTKKFSAYKRSPYCRDCFKENQSKKKSFSIEKIKKEFEKQGCVLITTTYKNAWDYLDYICACGTYSTTQYANFKKGVRSKDCKCNRKYTEDNVKRIVEESGCLYISQDGIELDSKVTFICVCGLESIKSIQYFIKTNLCNNCTHEIFINKVSGENSYMWNPNLTKEEREERRDFPEYVQWRTSVFERDNHTCQCCGEKGVKLNAHHKDGYHWCTERRIDVSNGVTLCEKCHTEFHSLYGIKFNTEEQFIEWLEDATKYNLYDELI